MLFISRYVYVGGHRTDDDFTSISPSFCAGVYDTDDGVEELASLSSLDMAYGNFRIDIEGIDSYSIDGNRYISEIRPYQPPETLTPYQLKLITLYGIHTTVFKNMLTGMWWENLPSEKPVVIRLSEIAPECGDYLLNNASVIGRQVVTIVLDDSVKFGTSTFKVLSSMSIGEKTLGVAFDLRELTDDDKASIIYSLYKGMSGYRSIIDRDDRKRAFVDRFR